MVTITYYVSNNTCQIVCKIPTISEGGTSQITSISEYIGKIQQNDSDNWYS